MIRNCRCHRFWLLGMAVFAFSLAFALFSHAQNPVGEFDDHVDIGAVDVAGDAFLDSGGYSVLGSGADIGGTADAFHFVYKELFISFIKK